MNENTETKQSERAASRGAPWLGRLYKLTSDLLDIIGLYGLRTDFDVWAYHQGYGKAVGMDDQYILWLEHPIEWHEQYIKRLKALNKSGARRRPNDQSSPTAVGGKEKQ